MASKKFVDCPSLKGYEKKTKKTKNSLRNPERKRKIHKTSINDKLIYAHNYTVKFPLRSSCLIPFSKHLKEVKLRNNSYYLLRTPKALFKQTTRNLFVTPAFATLKAAPGNAVELKAVMRAKCLTLVKKLCNSYPFLEVYAPAAEPITQEYAVKDSFAKKLPFTFKNDLGKFDKSVRIDKDGHKVTGGEVEYFRPEHADLYLEMPLRFAKMTDTFTENLAGYKEQIKFHLATLQDMRDTLQVIGKSSAPRKQRMPTAFKRSATVRGVN